VHFLKEHCPTNENDDFHSNFQVFTVTVNLFVILSYIHFYRANPNPSEFLNNDLRKIVKLMQNSYFYKFYIMLLLMKI